MKQENFADLYTAEGENICGIPWQEYPRPQLKRESFINLNGEWDFFTSENPDFPENFTEKIIVPYPPQSLLSKIHRSIPENEYLFYKKEFSADALGKNMRAILHFGAADQIALVWLNDEFLGEHTGGYMPFSFDITSVLKEENVLKVRVIDNLSEHILPYGKQSANRGGMWYTPVSGIWQTVWMEYVPEDYIRSVKINTSSNTAEIIIDGGTGNGKISVISPGYEAETDFSGGKAVLHFDNPRMWSPEDPFLYRIRITSGNDEVESYFALRSLTIENVNGIPRLCLNGKPYFFHGLLDQGYFSDGIFTPASPECFKNDILTAKSLGFNTLRKHIKIEPECFYHDCDRLGMIVFQDMVNNGEYNFIRDTALPTIGLRHFNDKFLHRKKESRKAFVKAMEETVCHLKKHPCICYWTIFNEGWGQFESTAAYRLMKKLDSSRFIASTSGWFKGGESDVESEHCYFRTFRPKNTKKPLVLTEFGGYAYAPENHIFNPDNEYGYKKFDSREKLVSAVTDLYEREIIPAIKKGLCVAIYTQLSDVEDETNGILSYDRKVIKIKPEDFLPVSEKTYNEIKKAGL
ncbi:MAG: glycoside hydrolase family 2 [Oscillospiraceae bacterium]|nr:glycoside hydrolase family 2 [Oscillospiraceae bacterium]